MKKIIPFLFIFWQLPAQPAKERNLFHKEFERCNFQQALLPLEQWCPYPNISGREFWSGISAEDKNYYVSKAEESLGKDWIFLPAMTYFEFSTTGNRDNYESLVWQRQERLYNAVMAELIENKGRFLNDIVNGIWAFCEESSWCWPAHIGMQKAGVNLPDVNEPIADLGVGVKAAALAWTVYLLKEKLDNISPLICQRVYQEIEKRLIIPVYERKDFGWMRYNSNTPPNNWVPWICSNYIACVLLTEKNKEKQAAYIQKAAELLDKFVNGYYEDGGCDEGPSYWSHASGSMFDCLDLLYKCTGGKFNLYNQTIIKNMGTYLPAMHIHDKYFVNFADASAVIDYASYKALIYQYGKETSNDLLMQFALSLSSKNNAYDRRFYFGHRLFRNLMFESADMPNPTQPPYLPFYWFEGIQVLTARDKQGTPEGLFLAAQGGHNNESHNHNDVGNFIVYDNGQPLLIDIGVETYTRKTFNNERYSIWTMQSQYHNCPTINGVMQSPGVEFRATNVNCTNTDSLVTFSLNLAKAYPDSAFVESWQRIITLKRNHSVTVTDNYKLKKTIVPNQWTFMSYPKPILTKPGVIGFEGSKRQLLFSSKKFSVKIEAIQLSDDKLQKSWGNTIYRILLTRQTKVINENINFVIQ